MSVKDTGGSFSELCKSLDKTNRCLQALAQAMGEFDEILASGYQPGAVHWFRNAILEVEVLVRLDRKCDECNGDWHCTELLTGEERVLPEEWISLPALNPLVVLALVGDENQ